MAERGDGPIKVGRYTAALSLIGLGILLLLDHAGMADALGMLQRWWPAALVALGIELILLQAVRREQGARVRIAAGTLIWAAVLGAFVLAFAKGEQFRPEEMTKWTESFGWGALDSGQAKYAIEKSIVTVPLRDSARKTVITNLNGDVTLTEGPVPDVEVKAAVKVDTPDRTQAEDLAQRSMVQIKEGDRVEITALGASYGPGGMRKAKMDLVVTFPQGKVPSSLEVQTGSGDVRIERLPDSAKLKLDVKNGDITGEQIGGRVQAKLVNGDIRLSDLRGATELEIVNGDATVLRPASDVSAKTVNGDIRISGAAVNGNWNATCVLGDVELAWPDGADVTVQARADFGSVNVSWPLQVSGHEASGRLGNGTWRISAETRGDVSLTRYAP